MSLLKDLLNIVDSSVEAFDKTLEYATELKDREELSQVLESLSSALSEPSKAQEILEFAGIFSKYAKLASLVLNLAKKSREAKDYTECVSVSFLIAYLESLAEFSKGISFNRIKKQKVSTSLRHLEVTDHEAKEALSNFPTSKLACVFEDHLAGLLETSDISENQQPQKIWLLERAKWKTQERMFLHWGSMPSKARIFQELSLSEIRGESEPSRALDRYFKKISKEISSLEDEISEIRLKRLYVPLDIQETDVSGKTINGRITDIHLWTSHFLANKEDNSILFIQADSGRGKTAFCRMFFQYVKEYIYPAYAPVFIRLRDIDEVKGNLQETLDSCLDGIPFFQNNSWLSDERKRFLFFLDGFDELPLESKAEVKKILKQIIKNQKGEHQFIITGRYLPSSELRSTLEEGSFRWAKILPMSEDSRSNWIAKWSLETLIKERGKELKDNFFLPSIELLEKILDNRIMLFVLATIGIACNQEIYSGTIKKRNDIEIKVVKAELIDKAIDILSGHFLFKDFLENPGLSLPLDSKRLVKVIATGILEIKEPSSNLFEVIKDSLPLIQYNICQIANSNNSFLRGLGISPGSLGIDEERYEQGSLNENEKNILEDIRGNKFPGLIGTILSERLKLPIGKLEKKIDSNTTENGSIMQIATVCELIISKDSKSKEFESFLKQESLNQENPVDDILSDFSREPILLLLLASLYFDSETNIRTQIISQSGFQAKVSIYQAALDRSFLRLSTTPLGKRLKDEFHNKPESFRKASLERVLEELALCITQSSEQNYRFSHFKEHLDKGFILDRESISIFGKSLWEDPILQDSFKGILSNYYVLSANKGELATLEFLHRSFSEFLFARRISKIFLRCKEFSSGHDNTNEIQFREIIYDTLGHELLSHDVLEYFNAILKNMGGDEELTLLSGFSRLNEFWTQWCSGYHLYVDVHNEISSKTQKYPWAGLQSRQRLQENSLNFRQIDVNTGLNVFILLLAMHRHAQKSLKLAKTMTFSPCNTGGENEAKDRENLLRTIGYCQSLCAETLYNMEESSYSSSTFFSEYIGSFLEKIDLGNAILTGVDLSNSNLKEANLNSVQLQRSNLRYAILEEAILTKADLSFSDLRKTIITNADFTDATLNHANLEGLNFRDLYKSKKENSTNSATANDRYEYRLSGVELVNANLTDVIFTGVDLSGSNLNGHDLRAFDFHGTNLTEAKMQRCNLQRLNLKIPYSVKGADFTNADLTGAVLRDVDLSGCTLNNLDLRSFDLSGTDLTGANLRQCNLQGIDLNEPLSLEGADFTNADLTGAVLRDVDLSGCTLNNLDLRSFDLSGTDLTGANLRQCNLQGIDLNKPLSFEGADFTDANLTDAVLKDVDFVSCTLDKLDLQKFDLSGTNLTRARLRKCNLKGIDFRVCQSVERADFTESDLSDANFSGVDLSKCNITHANLLTVKYDDKTQWPQSPL